MTKGAMKMKNKKNRLWRTYTASKSSEYSVLTTMMKFEERS